MRVIGVDEHVWRHTPYGDKFVTVILDLTPIRDRSGPSRLLDMVPGRSKQVFKTWLASQPDTWRERIEIVAMDGFTGWPGLVLWTGCFEGCWLLLVVLRPLACVLVG